MLRFEGIREQTLIASPARIRTESTARRRRLPLTTHLAVAFGRAGRSAALARVTEPSAGVAAARNIARFTGRYLLVETFRRGGREFLVAYCFEGRNAHQTNMLLAGVWSAWDMHRWVRRHRLCDRRLGLNAVGDPDVLFDEDMLGDDLEAWMDESSMLKRTFRNVAVIAGLIERNYPGKRKTGRQVTFSSDLIYDTLRQHQPNHILLRATRRDAARGLTDIRRLGDMLKRAKGSLRHRRLDRVSPLAVPVLLEIGKERSMVRRTSNY